MARVVDEHAQAIRECEAEVAEGVEEARRHSLEREELLAALVAAAESLSTLTAESEVCPPCPSRIANFPDEMEHFIARGLGDQVVPGQ